MKLKARARMQEKIIKEDILGKGKEKNMRKVTKRREEKKKEVI